MADPRKRSSEPQSGLLFGDLSATESLARTESIEVPPGDSLARVLADVKSGCLCGACRPGMPVVFGEGPEQAELMIIGEGPGVDDIQSELPFQGPAGMLLNRMLAAINVARAECYLCNVIKCVPPGERKFSVEEIEDCRPFLLRQILAVKPRIIIALGALAAQTLLRSKKTISDLRGNMFTLRLNEHEISIVPTFNPAYLLRVAEKKREAWEDLKLARELLKE
ncbi:MAG: uracil-DNA glycosylase [Acidobacteria bacterium]|nr:uracil-DNA glycosylase [Acidobacteriota bacterium]